MNIATMTKTFCELNQVGSIEDVNYSEQIERSAIKYYKYQTKKGKHVAYKFADESVLLISHYKEFVNVSVVSLSSLKYRYNLEFIEESA